MIEKELVFPSQNQNEMLHHFELKINSLSNFPHPLKYPNIRSHKSTNSKNEQNKKLFSLKEKNGKKLNL